jgi:regulation of enolase protein 1 (concanavalin A-like superfamily)
VDLLQDMRRGSLGSGLKWLNPPASWQVEGGLEIVPKAETDFFRPYRGRARDNACLLCRQVAGDFTSVAGLKADLVAFGDAGALTIRQDAAHWAKICLERSPTGDISIVSVVTDTWSDDSNGELLERPQCFLRLTRRGNVFGMHYSLDGRAWRFVRTFGFEIPETALLGIHAQAPFQGGCRVTFTKWELSDVPVSDFRSGE